jgi:ankyrin repeat protein
MMKARGGILAAIAAALLSAASAADNVDQPVKADGSTPLQWAAFEGDVAEAKRLIKAGADVHATNAYGINPMQLAADSANTELIALLLKAGADPESPNADGETALHLVARAGNVEAAKPLLKAGRRSTRSRASAGRRR